MIWCLDWKISRKLKTRCLSTSWGSSIYRENGTTVKTNGVRDHMNRFPKRQWHVKWFSLFPSFLTDELVMSCQYQRIDSFYFLHSGKVSFCDSDVLSMRWIVLWVELLFLFFYASIPLQWQVLKHTTGKKGEVTGGLSSHVIENISDLVFVQVILMALLIFLVMVSLLWWNILGPFLFFFLDKIWFQGIFNIKVLVKISEGKLIGNVWNSSREYMLEEVPIFTCDYGSK